MSSHGQDSSSCPNRREFTRQALQSLTVVALIEGLAAHRLFGADVKPIIKGWFRDLHAISFSIHVNGSDPGNPKSPGRVYIDPLREKVAGGLVKAPQITYGKANKLYG